MSTPGIHQRFTLQAVERLKLRQQIETLFRSGEAFSVFPLRVIYRLCPVAEGQSPVKAGFSVPKKRIKKATGRNRIKRLLREAWRLQKPELYRTIPAGQQLHIFLIFSGNEKLSFEEAMTAVKKTTDRLLRNLNLSPT